MNKKNQQLLNALLNGELPDKSGRFGDFGGQYAPETLMPALHKLEKNIKFFLADKDFQTEFLSELNSWAGRPTALTHAKKLSTEWGANVFLKREDLTHTGAHKINNALGQAMLAKKLGVKRIVAETGAGQHGVASAAACARVGLPCTVYMGAIDIERQAPNVDRMKQLGTKVIPVISGDQTLRAAIDEAFRDWVSDPDNTHYIIGSVVGPHPFPYLVREMQSIIGKEARDQIIEKNSHLPDAIFACVGGGSNAIGLFHAFLGDEKVELYGVEAGGTSDNLGENAATLASGKPGILHGTYSMLLHDQDGLIQETHSVSAGLDYPGVGPEHAFLQSIGRIEYSSARDEEALQLLREICELEGILPAIESSHAFVEAKKWAQKNQGKTILIGLSGRGDKDMPTLSKLMND